MFDGHVAHDFAECEAWDVARPLVAQQHLQRACRQNRRRASRRSVEVLQESVDRKGNVAAALAEGRQSDTEDLQPVRQILPKLPSATALCKSRLLAAVTRTFALALRVQLRWRNSPLRQVANPAVEAVRVYPRVHEWPSDKFT